MIIVDLGPMWGRGTAWSMHQILCMSKKKKKACQCDPVRFHDSDVVDRLRVLVVYASMLRSLLETLLENENEGGGVSCTYVTHFALYCF